MPMQKKTKFFISILFIFISLAIFQTCSAKYVIEHTYTIAKINIDRCPPNFELIDIISSNTAYPNYANKTHLISGHIKITEKNISKNDLSTSKIQITVGNQPITPEFKSFSLISENATEKLYEFSFTNTTHDGLLTLIFPEGIIRDKSGLINEKKYFSTNILIDNTPPMVTFSENTNSENGKSEAKITANENIQPINGWNLSNKNMELAKQFTNPISYPLLITDFAQNTLETFVNIQNATNISLQYGSLTSHNNQTLVSGGKISFSNTIPSPSVYIKLSTHINSSFKGKSYTYTNLKNGYDPASILQWITSRLKDISDFSIIFQAYNKDIGWSKVVSDPKENSLQSGKPVHAFRINFVPKTEKQYLIDFWNHDIGTTLVN